MAPRQEQTSRWERSKGRGWALATCMVACRLRLWVRQPPVGKQFLSPNRLFCTMYYVSTPDDPSNGRKDAATSFQIPTTVNAEITFSPYFWVWVSGCFEYRSAGMQTWQRKTSCRPQFQNLQTQSLGMELGRPDCFSTPLGWLCLALIGFLEITTWQRTGHKQPGWGPASKSRCDRRVALLMAPLPGKAQRRQEVRDPTLTPRLAENSHIPW